MKSNGSTRRTFDISCSVTWRSVSRYREERHQVAMVPPTEGIGIGGSPRGRLQPTSQAFPNNVPRRNDQSKKGEDAGDPRQSHARGLKPRFNGNVNVDAEPSFSLIPKVGRSLRDALTAIPLRFALAPTERSNVGIVPPAR